MKSVEELNAIREKFSEGKEIRNDKHEGIKVLVNMGTCGIAAGGREVVAAIVREISACKLDAQVIQIAQDNCADAPRFEVHLPGKEASVHTKMTPEAAAEIIRNLVK
ncbi:MAG: (2Fe-2S) ferredoxin domain-containing protein [Oscillospiraceae bacterium]|nr:(2Fe-2S) ferredoxin domain-containing protein [Oscillospiraceae bacterium]